MHNVIHVSWKQNCNAQHSAAVASPTAKSSARFGERGVTGAAWARHEQKHGCGMTAGRALDGHGAEIGIWRGGAYGSSGGDFRDLLSKSRPFGFMPSWK